MTEPLYDVVVVGSGFGGSVAALRLVEKGYRVLVLESGRRFADDELPRTSWDLRRYLWAPRLGCFGVQRIHALPDVLVLAGAGSRGPDAPPDALGLGFVDTADLPALYGAATVTAYASTYEGFGLPPLEAMACGGAVVASAVGGLPEAVMDGALLLDSADPGAWADALADVAGSDSASAALRGRAVADAARSTWERHVETCLAAYRNAGLTV